jgi:hypothetical protein
MALSAWVGKGRFEIGNAAFLKAWFSTIFTRLETERWGHLYPTIMHEFYGGKLSHSKVTAALWELEDIRAKLAALAPDQVVWDFEDRNAAPPWGSSISPQITSLADYFVTSDGKDLFEVLRAAFSEARERGQDVALG